MYHSSLVDLMNPQRWVVYILSVVFPWKVTVVFKKMLQNFLSHLVWMQNEFILTFSICLGKMLVGISAPLQDELYHNENEILQRKVKIG